MHQSSQWTGIEMAYSLPVDEVVVAAREDIESNFEHGQWAGRATQCSTMVNTTAETGWETLTVVNTRAKIFVETERGRTP